MFPLRSGTLEVQTHFLRPGVRTTNRHIDFIHNTKRFSVLYLYRSRKPTTRKDSRVPFRVGRRDANRLCKRRLLIPNRVRTAGVGAALSLPCPRSFNRPDESN